MGINRLLSIAPMIDRTDRHCRYFYRLLSDKTLLYTEMITADAILNGNKKKLLAFNPAEMPVVLQLGGSNPLKLADAALAGVDFGYQEVNLNIGCPSNRVQSGCFGAVLMKDPDLVLRCVSKMQEAVPDVPVTIKCRIGIDNQEPNIVLPDFMRRVSSEGVDTFIIHARKAILNGLSPKQNREIPPLDYSLVQNMKQLFPKLKIYLNGGIKSLEDANSLIMSGLDGVMIGRAAYRSPGRILLDADSVIFGEKLKEANQFSRMVNALEEMSGYIENELSKGEQINNIFRHLLWSFHGFPGSAQFRQMLSTNEPKNGKGVDILDHAIKVIKQFKVSVE